ncbi:MAG: DNA/RNA nuclease SfsA [Pseudomonadota bacterium]
MKLPELVRGTLLRRYKRFLADVALDSGEHITAHCPNTGAMTGCAEPGWPVWLSESDNPKRKYRHTWELVEAPQGYVSVNTGRANALVGEALAAGAITTLCGAANVKAEVKIPEGDGRFDYFVQLPAASAQEPTDVYIEVKSVTLLQAGGIGAFPDAVSSRALKHVQALQRRVAAGDRAVLLFCAQHCGVEQVRIASEIDPAYAAAVAAAAAGGVEVIAYGCDTDLREFSIRRQLPMHLP